MAYCDYAFYVSTYRGNVIAEADFPRLAERASDMLDNMTFGAIESELDEEYRNSIIYSSTSIPLEQKIEIKVKKTVCAIAEKLADIETANATIRAQGGIGVASVSSGSESISFRNDNAYINGRETKSVCYEVAKDYLTGTGLLYAGL